ncbi:MAG: hypothetical protein AAGD38_11875 [Acidobacteriota bacterium]
MRGFRAHRARSDRQQLATTKGVEMDPQNETARALELLRQLIRTSPYTQRQVEERAGFSRGYLSQLLHANLDLKYRHILLVLDVLDMEPRAFFARLFPDPEADVLQRFRERSAWRSDTVAADLETLYDAGLESVRQLRKRIETCERVLDRLGLLDDEARR